MLKRVLGEDGEEEEARRGCLHRPVQKLLVLAMIVERGWRANYRGRGGMMTTGSRRSVPCVYGAWC